LDDLSGQDYLESHLPLFEKMAKKLNPQFTVELGCGYFTTPHLDRLSVSHISFESREPYLREVEKATSYKHTDFVFYSRIERVLHDLDLFKSTYDLAVVGGPIPDRVQFCQKVLDLGCKCTLLLDYESESLIGYRKLRYSQSVYDFRVFTNFKTGVQTGVFLINYLNSLSIKDHE
jgi:hypothetical protein